MNIFKSAALTSLVFLLSLVSIAQYNPDAVYAPNIHSVRFHMYGDQLTMPVYRLNSGDKMELHFDDVDNKVKNYYYTYQLCDINWQPVNLSPFDFIKGFTQQRITNYRFSSIAYTRYIHYQAILPDANSQPLKSGNYLLKVFLDGDTSNHIFTRGLLVVDNRASVSAQIIQPFTPQFYKTHQRIKFNVNLEGLNAFNANQQVKAVVLQNYQWPTAQSGVAPTFIRGNVLEYNSESNFIFPGGKEWRWVDLRSLKLLSERVDHSDNKKNSVDIYVKTDVDRNAQRYIFYADLDGLNFTATYETVNPYWQGDYSTVHFSFATPSSAAYPGKDLYLTGQLTDNQLTETNKMTFNTEKGLYEGSQFLKQGYYDYGYTLVDRNDPSNRTELDGNYWETENTYTILIYYRSFTDQADQLIGVAKVSSRSDRPGFSF